MFYSPLCRPLHAKVRGIPSCCQALYTTHTTQLSLASLFKHTIRFVSFGLCFASNRIKWCVTYTKLRPPWLSPCHKHHTKSSMTQPCLAQLLYKTRTYCTQPLLPTTAACILAVRRASAVIRVVSTSCRFSSPPPGNGGGGCYRLPHKLRDKLKCWLRHFAHSLAVIVSWFICLPTCTIRHVGLWADPRITVQPVGLNKKFQLHRETKPLHSGL